VPGGHPGFPETKMSSSLHGNKFFSSLLLVCVHCVTITTTDFLALLADSDGIPSERKTYFIYPSASFILVILQRTIYCASLFNSCYVHVVIPSLPSLEYILDQLQLVVPYGFFKLSSSTFQLLPLTLLN
jgi:hypothetical protein